MADCLKIVTRPSLSVVGLGDAGREGRVMFEVRGGYGATDRIDTAGAFLTSGVTNLTPWTPLLTPPTPHGIGQFSDVWTTNAPHRFYRAVTP